MLRKHMEYPELKRAVSGQCEAFDASAVLIADKASHTQLIQGLVEQGLHASPATSRGRTRSCALGVAKGTGRKSDGRPQ